MQRRFVVRESGFVGYNDRLSPDQLPSSYLADALNCFMRSGEIVKRTGYTIIANDIGLNKPCQGKQSGKFANGTQLMVAVFNGSVYQWTGSGNWTLATSGSGVLSNSALVDIVFANNAFYFFDGSSTVIKHNGTTCSTVATIPKGKFARWFHNQLHVGGISGSPNKLQSSDIGDPELFVGANSSSLDVNPNDGDEISGMNELKDQLIVFKKGSIWAMSGFGTTALTLSGLSQSSSGFGTISHRSILNIGNALLYIGFLGDKPIIRSLTRTMYGTLVDGGIMSDDIEGTMNGLNKTSLVNAAAIFDGKYAWFALPNGSSTTNNLVITLNTLQKGWTRHVGINASVFNISSISGQAQMYFGEAGNTSKSYVFDTSTSDNGTAINWSIKTRRYGGEEADIKKKYKWIYISAKEVGNYTITIDYSIDGFTFSNLGTQTLTGTGTVFDDIILDVSRLGATDINKKRFTIPKSRHYYVQFNLYDTSAVSRVTIKSWELYFFKKAPVSTVTA